MKKIPSVTIILSLLLLFSSSFALNIVLRLKSARKDYPSSDAFENDCHMSDKFLQGSFYIYLSVILVSVTILVIEVKKKL